MEVEAEDRAQLLQDIMAVFAELKTQVSSVNARVRKDGMAVASLTVQIRDLDHLHKILTKLGTLQKRTPRLPRDQARARRAGRLRRRLTPAQIAIPAVAAFAAGAMNSVAGGGSFLSFPALIFAGVRRSRPTRRTTARCGSARSAARAATKKRSANIARFCCRSYRERRRRADRRVRAAPHAADDFRTA